MEILIPVSREQLLANDIGKRGVGLIFGCGGAFCWQYCYE